MTNYTAEITKQAKPQKKKLRLIIFTIIFSVIYLFVISYLDSEVLSPLILPNDYCYYHKHEVPWWVELFYMTPASNGHPDGSFFQMFIFLILSVLLGYITSRTLMNKLNKRN